MSLGFRSRYNFGSEKYYPEVSQYSDLPNAVGYAGHIYLVLTGEWSGLYYHRAGLYRSNGVTWSRLANLTTISDEVFTLFDEADNTKGAMFECSTIGAGTTCVYTFPNATGTLALQSWVGAGYQPLDDVLTDLSALSVVADNEFIVGTGAGTYTHESGATARTSIGLGTGDSPAFTGLTISGNTLLGTTPANQRRLSVVDSERVVAVFEGSNAVDTIVDIDARGGANADAAIRLLNSGTTEWFIGFDNSDGDKFKIAREVGFASTRFDMTEAGDVGIYGTLAITKTTLSGNAFDIDADSVNDTGTLKAVNIDVLSTGAAGTDPLLTYGIDVVSRNNYGIGIEDLTVYGGKFKGSGGSFVYGLIGIANDGSSTNGSGPAFGVIGIADTTDTTATVGVYGKSAANITIPTTFTGDYAGYFAGDVAVVGNLVVRNGQELRFNDTGDSHYVGFKAPALTASQIWTLPTADGNADEIVKTDGAGVLSFVRMPKAIYAELSDSTDQAFAVAGTHYSITFNTNDELVGITHSTTVNPENITIDTTGVYTIFAQPQVAAAAGGAGTFHMWLQRDTGGGFADIANTNIELTLASLDEDVIPLATTFALDSGDIIRLRVVVSDNKISLDAQAAIVGPPTEPAIPSIIFTMFMIGGS